MATAWKSVVIHSTEMKLQVETVADTTVISLKFCVKLGRSTLDGAARTLEAYDGTNSNSKEQHSVTWHGRIETLQSYPRQFCYQTRISESLGATSYSIRGLSGILHGPGETGETEAWGPTNFPQSLQHADADARGSKSKATGQGRAARSRASAAQRS